MRITVNVKPGSKKGPLVEQSSEGTYIVYLRERAVDGAANEGLIKILAQHFEVAKSKITIEAGFSSRIKRISINI
ncbi:MAG: DUF167 domain-containing protein [Rhodoluna sp.]